MMVPADPMAEPIRYPLNHWAGFKRLLNDGRIEIDNKNVERRMGPIALRWFGRGRRKLGRGRLADRNCKLNRVDPKR